MDLIFFCGQSNMQGQSECLSECETVTGAYEYKFLSDALVPLKNPVGEDITYDLRAGYPYSERVSAKEWRAKHALGSACYGHTNLVPAFCRAYTAHTKREVAAAHMNPGDILVMCPEIGKYQYGYNEMNTTTWQIFEGAYNAYADVDIRNFTKMFNSFSSFNNNRYSSGAKTYEQFHKSVNSYGDYILYHETPLASMAESFAKWRSGNSLTNIDTNLLKQSYNANMNKAIQMVLDKGGKVYYSFAATSKTGLNAVSQTLDRQNEYKEAVAQAFPKAVVISDPGTFILEDKWFYNSIYHVTTAGAAHRTKLLAKDILAQLAKEK